MTEQRFPQIGVGAVVFKNGKVLLVKRKYPPAEHQWALPGGRLQWGETLKEACEREIFEETGIKIKAKDLIHTFEIIDRQTDGTIRFHYVILDFSAEYIEGTAQAGDDALEARWFNASQLKQIRINPYTKELLEQKLNFFQKGD